MLKLNRSIQLWKNCNPEAMVHQSNAALCIAFEDAKHDILALAEHIRKLEAQIGRKLEKQSNANQT